MPGSRWARWADNALFACGLVALGAIAAAWDITGRPASIEIITWAAATAVLMIAIRVYQRITVNQLETLRRLNSLVASMTDKRKCAACDYCADPFTVLMHEGAVHGL